MAADSENTVSGRVDAHIFNQKLRSRQNQGGGDEEGGGGDIPRHGNALAEEFLCRGILLDAARAKGGAAYGLLFSALFFGVIHFYPAAVVNAFVMGLLLGFIYIRSNSLYIVVILHAFNNALAMLLLTLGYAHTTLYELMSAHGLKMLYTVVYGVSLGIFLVAGYMVWKTIARLREQEQAAAEAQ